MPERKTYIVEHLDPELGPWSELEYATIARETEAAGGTFVLSSLPAALALSLPAGLAEAAAAAAAAAAKAKAKAKSEAAAAADDRPASFRVETRAVEVLYPPGPAKDRVCLLDPAADRDLSPDDKRDFDVFLFGGILGDDPPRDRTSELRRKGFHTRRLGPKHMTTDTAVRVTRMVVDEQFTLGMIPYVDHPDLKLGDKESTQMPFRYVADDDGKPIMPEGMIDLIRKDADKSIDDLF